MPSITITIAWWTYLTGSAVVVALIAAGYLCGRLDRRDGRVLAGISDHDARFERMRTFAAASRARLLESLLTLGGSGVAVGRASVACPPVRESLAQGREPVDRVAHSATLAWGMLNAPGAALTVDLQCRRAESLADLVPDEERPVEDDGEDEHPRDLVTDGSMSMWRPRGRSLQPAGASLVRQLFRRGATPAHTPRHAAQDDRERATR